MRRSGRASATERPKTGSYRLSSRTSWIACHWDSHGGLGRACAAAGTPERILPGPCKTSDWKGALTPRHWPHERLPPGPLGLLPGIHSGIVVPSPGIFQAVDTQGQRLGSPGGLRRAVVCGAEGAEKTKNQIQKSSRCSPPSLLLRTSTVPAKPTTITSAHETEQPLWSSYLVGEPPRLHRKHHRHEPVPGAKVKKK